MVFFLSQPANTNPFADDVAAEELQMKIEENARLQREVKYKPFCRSFLSRSILNMKKVA